MIELRKTILISVIAFLPVFVIGQVINPQLLRKKALHNQGNYTEALAISIIPSDDSEEHLNYMIQGECAFKSGDIDLALDYFQKAENMNPGSAAIELARCYRMAGDNRKMFEYLAIHLDSPDKLPRKDIFLDPAFSGLDRDREWIRFWSKPWYNEADDIIAEASYRLVKEDFDNSFWEKLISDYPGNAVVLSLVARKYAIIGDQARAFKFFDEALKADPDNSEINFYYANYLLEKQSFDKALVIFDRMIAKYPYDIRFYLHRALLLFKSGQSQRGIEEMERLESLGIDASDMNFLLAVEVLNDDPSAAIRYIEPVLKLAPTAQAFNLRARARVMLGDPSAALSDFCMSLDFDPDQPDVYFERAGLRLESGDKEGACYDWQNALRLGHRKAADMLYKHCK